MSILKAISSFGSIKASATQNKQFGASALAQGQSVNKNASLVNLCVDNLHLNALGLIFLDVDNLDLHAL